MQKYFQVSTMPNFQVRRFSTIIESMSRHGSFIDSRLLFPPLPFMQQCCCISKSSRPLGYYDSLEVTPNATQAQVKKQYYELSKQYHPDTNKKDNAAKKFRDISEAYEVLGNITKRRMYDQGVLNIGVASSPAEAEDYSKKFYESRSKRRQAPTTSGRTPIYDFDEWSKLHYENTFRRKENAKDRLEFLRKRAEKEKEESKSESVMMVMVFFVCLVFYQTTIKGIFDRDTREPKKSD